MKTMILFAFALIFFSGCSGAIHRYSSDRVTIQTRSLPSTEYRLLSVRADTAFVVTEPEEAIYDDHISYSHAFIIAKDSIILIESKGHGGFVREGIGVLGGMAIGMGIAMLQNTPEGNKSSGWFSGTPNGNRLAYGIYGGSLVGGLIGMMLPAPVDHKLSNSEEIKYLRSISLYPDKEPDEMQYIK